MNKKLVLLAAVVLAVVLFFATHNPFAPVNGADGVEATPSIQSTENETASTEPANATPNATQATPSPGVQPTAYPSEQLVFVEPHSCGDGDCNPPEGCAVCPADCRCDSGEYCNQTTNTCKLQTECGDSICDEFELNRMNCCADCGCSDWEVCDDYSNECISAGSLPSDEEAGEIALTYFANQTTEYWVESVGQSAYNGATFVNVIVGCENEFYACGAWLTINATGEVVGIAYVN